jgi:hypothetical protein
MRWQGEEIVSDFRLTRDRCLDLMRQSCRAGLSQTVKLRVVLHGEEFRLP